MSQWLHVGQRCGGTTTCWPADTYAAGDSAYGHMMTTGGA